MKREEYLSDEELEKLIAETETDKVFNPPEYLEAETLQKIGTYRMERRIKRSRREFSLYALKISAAAAAAILVIFTTPSAERLHQMKDSVPRQEQQDHRDGDGILKRLSGSLYEHLDSVTDQMMQSGNEIRFSKEDINR
ncbi:MAG: hypothetical protein LKF52_09955 [Butyrivibrio sp.]|jgi:hypothetical protein|nr:hypothetical protein [Butyrivibrio sp.]